MGLKALGLAELHEQEQAVRALGSLGTVGAPEHANRLQVQRPPSLTLSPLTLSPKSSPYALTLSPNPKP